MAHPLSKRGVHRNFLVRPQATPITRKITQKKFCKKFLRKGCVRHRGGGTLIAANFVHSCTPVIGSALLTCQRDVERGLGRFPALSRAWRASGSTRWVPHPNWPRWSSHRRGLFRVSPRASPITQKNHSGV